jgi:acyl-CoA thioesterase
MQPHGLALVINGIRQSTMVWGGRAVGMSRIAAAGSVQGNFCPGTMHGYLVQLGFGTLASTMPAEGLSVVGRQLRDGEAISIRFDVCTAEGCTQGSTKQMTVRVR